MALIPKNDVTQIFASQAPAQDTPAAFANYNTGWDASRANNGKPTIKQFNYIQQRTDQNVLYIHQNGAALPYDATMEYAENATVVKDGVLQQWKAGAWVQLNKADAILDASGKTQQEINDEQATKNTEQDSLNNKLDSSFANLTDLLSCNPKYLFDGNIYKVGGIRGGLFKWSVSSTKAVNDGTVFAHTSVQNGKFERIYSGIVYAEWFGAEPYVIGGTQDSTVAFQKVADFCGIGGSWKFKGLHRITSNIFIPARQNFGGDAGLNSPHKHLTNDPVNWQGVNTGTGETGDAIFYDSYTGDAITLGEGAKPENFLLYGKGVTTLGVDTTLGLPLSTWSGNTSNGLRYGKFIKPKNVTVAYFKYAFASIASPAVKGGVNVSGNYYQKMQDCEVMYCYAAFRFADAIAYNHKAVNLKVTATTKLIDSAVELRNIMFFGGSYEGYTDSNTVRTGTDIAFIGTYFETFATTAVPSVFVLEDYCSLIFRDCLVYLNNCNYFARDFTATLNSARIVSTGNKFRTGGSNTLAANYIYSITYAINAFGSISGDAITYKTGNVINYVNGKAVNIKKDDPMLLLI